MDSGGKWLWRKQSSFFEFPPFLTVLNREPAVVAKSTFTADFRETLDHARRYMSEEILTSWWYWPDRTDISQISPAPTKPTVFAHRAILITLPWHYLDPQTLLCGTDNIPQNIVHVHIKCYGTANELCSAAMASYSGPHHTKIIIRFRSWNCWQIDVDPVLFTLLQPEMPTDGVWIGRCD